MKKRIAIVLASCLTLSVAVGCNAFAADTAANVATTTEKATPNENRFMGAMGKVTAINGSDLTIILAEKPDLEDVARPERPTSEDGTRPERPVSEDGTPPERPTAEDGTAIEKPNGRGNMVKDMKFTGETITVTITDDVAVKLDRDTTGTITDIAVDYIVMLEYGEDEATINAIALRNMSSPETEAVAQTD